MGTSEERWMEWCTNHASFLPYRSVGAELWSGLLQLVWSRFSNVMWLSSADHLNIVTHLVIPSMDYFLLWNYSYMKHFCTYPHNNDHNCASGFCDKMQTEQNNRADRLMYWTKQVRISQEVNAAWRQDPKNYTPFMTFRTNWNLPFKVYKLKNSGKTNFWNSTVLAYS